MAYLLSVPVRALELLPFWAVKWDPPSGETEVVARIGFLFVVVIIVVIGLATVFGSLEPSRFDRNHPPTPLRRPLGRESEDISDTRHSRRLLDHGDAGTPTNPQSLRQESNPRCGE